MAISNSNFRISGLASGLDTDDMISKLMMAARMPVDRIKQKRDVATWKIEEYRNITTKLKDFKDKYLDFLNSDSYMMSKKAYKSFDVSVMEKLSGKKSEAVSISTNGNTFKGDHTIKVDRLATAANTESTDQLSGVIISKEKITDLQLKDKKIFFKLDGVEKSITLDNYDNVQDMANDIQSKLNNSFGKGLDKINGKIDVTEIDGKLKFITKNGADELIISPKDSYGTDALNIKSGVGSSFKMSEPITDFNLKGINVEIVVDGSRQVLELDEYEDSLDMKEKINDKLKEMFGVGDDGLNGKVEIVETVPESGMFEIKACNGNDEIEIYPHSADANYSLNLGKGITNRINIGYSLDETSELIKTPITFGGVANDEIEFKINGESFKFDKDSSLRDIMNSVNSNENAAVLMKYDKVTDKVLIQSKKEGAGINIMLEEVKGTLFSSLGIVEGAYENGQDALVTVDGQDMVRSSNNFTVNDVTYELKNVTSDELTVKMKIDTDKVYDNIKEFIDSYNDIIETINTEINEEYDNDYLPLTDQQKEAMSEKDIEKWEEKGKTGLLKNDSTLSKIVRNLRNSIIESVEGISKSMSSIGISTKNYKDKGKLTIDEEKLKEAIANEPDTVAELFAKKSKDYPSYSRSLKNEEMRTRFEQEGIVSRIFDVIEDSISTFRDENGYKGSLLVKAGMEGDSSELKNVLADDIEDYEDRILEMEKRLIEKENNYYKEFAALETYMSKMNNQSQAIFSQMSGMNA